MLDPVYSTTTNFKDVLTKKYGEQSQTKKLNDEYKLKKNLMVCSAHFKNVLASSGFTDASYKDTIRLNLLIEEAVRKGNSEVLLIKEVKAAYDAFTLQ